MVKLASGDGSWTCYEVWLAATKICELTGDIQSYRADPVHLTDHIHITRRTKISSVPTVGALDLGPPFLLFCVMGQPSRLTASGSPLQSILQSLIVTVWIRHTVAGSARRGPPRLSHLSLTGMVNDHSIHSRYALVSRHRFGLRQLGAISFSCSETLLGLGVQQYNNLDEEV